MQGYFSLNFHGTRRQTDKLVYYLANKKDEDQLHSFLFCCLGKDLDYAKKEEDEATWICVDMSNVGGSGNVSWFDMEEIVSELCEAVPELSMSGQYRLVDASSQQNYTSEEGSSSYREEWVNICSMCSHEFADGETIYEDEEGTSLCQDCYRNELIELITAEDETDYEDLMDLTLEELETKWPECTAALGCERME